MSLPVSHLWSPDCYYLYFYTPCLTCLTCLTCFRSVGGSVSQLFWQQDVWLERGCLATRRLLSPVSGPPPAAGLYDRQEGEVMVPVHVSSHLLSVSSHFLSLLSLPVRCCSSATQPIVGWCTSWWSEWTPVWRTGAKPTTCWSTGTWTWAGLWSATRTILSSGWRRSSARRSDRLWCSCSTGDRKCSD